MLECRSCPSLSTAFNRKMPEILISHRYSYFSLPEGVNFYLPTKIDISPETRFRSKRLFITVINHTSLNSQEARLLQFDFSSCISIRIRLIYSANLQFFVTVNFLIEFYDIVIEFIDMSRGTRAV